MSSLSEATPAAAPDFLRADRWIDAAARAREDDVARALAAAHPGAGDLAALLSPAAEGLLEPMARKAQALTRRHFGRTVALYAPLYLSNFCSGGCAYCGFASDRDQPRHRLDEAELLAEIAALKAMGMEDVLLLTGERCPGADFDYLQGCVQTAARHFHNVTVESFAMTAAEYGRLADAGCTGITLYQETYDPVAYSGLHRWGPKQDYLFRLEAPERALGAGIRTAGVGVLLGLAEPVADALRLYLHARHLLKKHWRAGVAVSFPRLCAEQGHFRPAHAVDDRFLARMIYAFRICLPDVPLVLSTRERVEFRDGMAGVGISRMSVASRTTVGGYHAGAAPSGSQFDVHDHRGVDCFCRALRARGLEPVFKNWDAVFQDQRP